MDNPGIKNSTSASESRMPAPRAMFRIMNPLMKLMLLSPFHGGMSRRLMVLTFTGRKTGKRYATPVGFLRGKSGSILVFTHSAWRNNFKQPAPVTLRIQGKDVQGVGKLVTDPLRIQQIVSELIAANGEEMSRRMNLWVDHVETASPEEVLKATQGTYYIEIQVKP
jgi:hypothetical protein